MNAPRHDEQILVAFQHKTLDTTVELVKRTEFKPGGQYPISIQVRFYNTKRGCSVKRNYPYTKTGLIQAGRRFTELTGCRVNVPPNGAQQDV